MEDKKKSKDICRYTLDRQLLLMKFIIYNYLLYLINNNYVGIQDNILVHKKLGNANKYLPIGGTYLLMQIFDAKVVCKI